MILLGAFEDPLPPNSRNRVSVDFRNLLSAGLKLLIPMITIGVFKDVLAISTLHFTSQHNIFVQDTGGCPQSYVKSEAGCAMQCYLQTWCRVYVLGPCDQGPPNPCLCVICQMDPVINDGLVGNRTVGMLSTSLRLVDNGKCGRELRWTSVDSSCTDAVLSISSTFTVSPILALELTRVEEDAEKTAFFATPVCPPTFSPRGEIECHSTDGIWQRQNTLACFSTECYQQRGDKQYYAGTKNVSKSGRPCWTWQYDGPFGNHVKDYPFTFDYYDVVKAKNYCRVVLSEEYGALWCYNANFDENTDPLRWEDCDVPECLQVYKKVAENMGNFRKVEARS